MKERNKELIELIKEGLRNAEERPYKEGAWEAYKTKYEPRQKAKYFALPWVAAAAIALAGLTFLFLDRTDAPESIKIVETEQQNIPSNPMNPVLPESATGAADQPVIRTAGSGHMALIKEEQETGNLLVIGRQHIVTLEGIDVQATDLAHLKSHPRLMTEIRLPEWRPSQENNKPLATLSWDDDLITGEQVNPNFAYQSEVSPHVSPKKVRLTERMELGAFVSPSTTDRSFDLGGGLVFAYRFNDKLAIRTGASFNQYEVAMLKSHVQEIGEEKKQAAAPIKNTDKLISKEVSSLRTNSFFIPNLNAVTGKVQTLDIPLEIRYNLTKEFYATGGVSYAAVLFQERFDHYEESAGIPTYSSASDSEEPVENPVTTIKTTQVSNDENINTNGFGGFVNFSVGRRVNMGKTMKVSIEPFVKFPVGQFKRADMNYTNGGIRIMTSF